ncbi:hypothetical protein C8R44DRAFT_890548 [Mycena epipterygia]|nr:hypothetical protein C8R44DRAFT_890548 [Mycena epipterygia]
MHGIRGATRFAVGAVLLVLRSRQRGISFPPTAARILPLGTPEAGGEAAIDSLSLKQLRNAPLRLRLPLAIDPVGKCLPAWTGNGLSYLDWETPSLDPRRGTPRGSALRYSHRIDVLYAFALPAAVGGVEWESELRGNRHYIIDRISDDGLSQTPPLAWIPPHYVPCHALYLLLVLLPRWDPTTSPTPGLILFSTSRGLPTLFIKSALLSGFSFIGILYILISTLGSGPPPLSVRRRASSLLTPPLILCLAETGRARTRTARARTRIRTPLIIGFILSASTPAHSTEFYNCEISSLEAREH